ncbi:YnbE family lipoprotein [Roseospirillum parvum]|uniref:YnbE-like lipoprotein n=1 Tax=Roseospirillum parvum TaxID=83401 RepID=A0A1G7XKN8_9PROT|nr:YnbE family lipoprotein [Roseospirillum parvum]SDG84636.1 YnbE-like lipoprotein [Roseospirillum parvum]
MTAALPSRPPSSPRRPALLAGLLMAALLVGPACSPTVKVEAPDKPIVINMNIKIEQDVRVRLERDVEQVLQENPEIF